MKKLILFPFLLAFFPAWVLILKNIEEIIIDDILITVGITGLSIIIWMIMRKVLDSNKAALILGLGILIFFYFGYFQNALEGITINDNEINRTSYLGIFSIVGFTFLTVLIIKSNRSFDNFIKIINFVTVVFVIIAVVELVPNAEAEQPNIYHIILDEYTSNEVLEKKFDHKNYDFAEFLLKNNFVIPEKSFSTFNTTDVELLTILNFEYPDIKNYGKTYQNYESLKNNKVMKILSNEDYHIIETNSMMRWKDFKQVDEKICYDIGFINSEFLEQVLSKSIIKYFLEKHQENTRRDVVRCTFNSLNDLPLKQYDKPIYVFSHMYIPHPPFLFGPNGEDVIPNSSVLGGLQSWEYQQGYINQVMYATKEIQKVVSSIVKNDPNAIIILQGDTGTNTGLSEEERKEIKGIYHTHSILYALRIPSIEQIESAHAVNTYRIIFNEVFDDEYDILEQENFTMTENLGYREFSKELMGFEYNN
tara:strand:+ start:408 stop:1838 length:1431 start_codon:yes stop_codon:yes gene_type:complete